jgi:hypothetical protein
MLSDETALQQLLQAPLSTAELTDSRADADSPRMERQA